MGSLYLRGGQYDRAVLATRSACLVGPKNSDHWARLAMVHYRAALAAKNSDRLSDARSAAEKSIELDPEGAGRQVLQMIDGANL
jgi:cytochrome c-type biogenesis protein CcmH/NrfG